MYKVISEGNDFVLKFPYDELTFDREKMVLEALQKCRFRAPRKVCELLYEGKRGIVMTYVQGLNIEETLLSKKIVREIVKTIYEFNNLNVHDYRLPIYDYETIIGKYYQNIELIPNYINEVVNLGIRERIEHNLELLKEQDYDKLIHRDLRMGNIIADGDNIVFIDFEGCAIGNQIMDLVKIYNEIKNYDRDMADYFICEYQKYNNVERKKLINLIEIYTLLDKINTIIWCINRKRVGSEFFYETISYIERSIKEWQ